MNFEKIQKYIFEILKIKKNKSRTRNKITLNKIDSTSFRKKRRKFVIKNDFLDKFKIFWNNIFHYYLLIIFILIISIAYIFIWPLFKIKNIEIVKQDNITNMLIAYKSVEDYRWKSIFTIEKKEILNDLKNYQNNIENIKTNIILPNTLKILVSSYKWIFNTTINDKTYIVTENWTLIPSNYSEELKELIIVNEFSKNTFYDYKKTLDSKYILEIWNLINSIKENIINLNIKEIKYYLVEREVHIETESNTTIIFDLSYDTKQQIEKLAVFNKEYLDIIKNKFVYIDLRVNNKIFYCSLENEYQCIQNLKSVYSK